MFWFVDLLACSLVDLFVGCSVGRSFDRLFNHSLAVAKCMCSPPALVWLFGLFVWLVFVWFFWFSWFGCFFLNFGLGFKFRDLPPGSTAASVAYCTIPRFPKHSYFGRQVTLASTTHGSPLAAKGGSMGEKWWPNGGWDMHPGFFYKSATWDR